MRSARQWSGFTDNYDYAHHDDQGVIIKEHDSGSLCYSGVNNTGNILWRNVIWHIRARFSQNPLMTQF